MVNAEPSLEFRDIHDPASVRSGPDLPKVTPRLDLEENAFRVNS